MRGEGATDGVRRWKVKVPRTGERMRTKVKVPRTGERMRTKVKVPADGQEDADEGEGAAEG